ncbi:MAG: phosphatase PAP2 family protein [Terriglobia bacterium]
MPLRIALSEAKRLTVNSAKNLLWFAACTRSMPNNPSENTLNLWFRLEDAVALLFFLIILALEVLFRGLRGQRLDPSDVMVVIPAIVLILAKEAANHFIAGRNTRDERDEGETTLPCLCWRVIRDWFPLLVIVLMYYALWGKATLLIQAHDRDAMLLGWDKWLFGVEPSVWIERIVSPRLTSWMEFAYSFHLYAAPIVACFIYLFRPRARFREMTCGLVVITFFGVLGYLIVPAIGPMYTLHSVYTVPLTQPLAIFNRQIEFMDLARVQRDCFPSLHVGISFLVWLYAWRNSKTMFWILSPVILSLWLSTVYLRYHYAVDCIAGFILAPLCYALANWLYQHHARVRVPAPLPAGWAQRIRRLGQPAPLRPAPSPQEHP